MPREQHARRQRASWEQPRAAPCRACKSLQQYALALEAGVGHCQPQLILRAGLVIISSHSRRLRSLVKPQSSSKQVMVGLPPAAAGTVARERDDGRAERGEGDACQQ